MISKRTAAIAAMKHVYGGTLDNAGRGFYVALELLAVFWGVAQRGETPLDPDDDKVRYHRRTHDFARRLVVNVPELPPTHRDEVGDGAVLDLVGSVVESLRMPFHSQKHRRRSTRCTFARTPVN